MADRLVLALATICCRSCFVPVFGRKALVVFVRRVNEADDEFDWSYFSLRLVWEPSPRSRLAAQQEASLRGWSRRLALTALRCILPDKCVRLRWQSGAMIKAAYAVGCTPNRQENTQEPASSRFFTHHSLILYSQRNPKVRHLIAFSLIQLVNSKCNMLKVSYSSGAG